MRAPASLAGPVSGHRTSHAARYREIAEVLARHGLGFLVSMLGLNRLVPFHRGLLGHPRRPLPYTRPEHVRMALEDLGATFVKLGQIASTRPDLVPPEYQTELAGLQDDVPPGPWDQIRQSIEAELAKPVADAFASFSTVPLASASIGQAYEATLHDGSDVVVKARRPGIMERVEQDLDVLQGLAERANRRWEVARDYDLPALTREFGQTLRAELDYVREGHNAERFAANFADVADVHVPRIYWDLTTQRVITLERIRGIKISNVQELDQTGIDRPALARRAAEILLKMVFEDGFFHADPHPGNFFVEPEGRIGLIDFGMVGVVDEPTQEQLGGLMLAIVSGEPDRLVDAFLAVGAVRGHIDRALLGNDLRALLASYYGRPISELPVGRVIREGQAVIRRHHLTLPTNLALLLKTIVMAEGVAGMVDPNFSMASVLAPYGQRLMLRRLSPTRLAREMGEAGVNLARLASDSPERLRRLLAILERGELEIAMRPIEVEPILRRVERLTNRIVLGLVAAAFINGLAILMSVYHPPGWSWWAAPAFAFGFLVATGLGGYLAWSILRSRR